MKKSRLIILSLTLLSLALSGCKTSPVRESGFDLLSEANWGLVSSTSSLEKDDYLILVHNNGEDNYTFKHFEDDSFNAISVNLESEEVDQNISQFLLGINEEGYTLKAHDGGYLAYDQNNEVLTLSNSAYLWNISISDGVASISSNAKKIFYRKSSQDFTITSFSKSNISLYKAMPDVFPTSIALSKDTLELNIGENFTFEVSYLPEDTNKRGVIWSSSDLSVVTVDNGKIIIPSTAEIGSTATITATSKYDENIKASCEINVIDKKIAAWTIMIYMCGSDLESDYGIATSDLSEILSVSGQPEDINIIIETGGAKKWKSKYGISNKYLQRWHVDNQKLVLNDALPLADMSQESTFASFVTWGLEEYPATNTGIIMWNHGGAVGGVCYDDNFNSGYGALSAAEVVGGISTAFTSVGRTDKLTFIGYDACIMSFLDNASINADYFDYMIASQELEAGDGWDYDTWVDDLYAKKDKQEIFKAICDGFVADNGGQDASNDQCLALFDLSKMDEVVTAFEAFAASLNVDKSNWSNLLSAYNSSMRMARDEELNAYLYGVSDAISLINQLENQFTGVDGTDVISAINNLISYNVYGGYYNSTRGYPCGVNAFVAYSNNKTYGLQCSKSDYTKEDTKLTTWRNYMILYGF